jgi:hypothetical protein
VSVSLPHSLRHGNLALALLAACVLLELALLPVGIDDLDEGYFAQQAVRIQSGELPFRDFESLYTPGLAYVHGALFNLFGGPYLLAPRALSLVLRGTLAVLLYVLARPVVEQPLWAALPGAFVLLGFDAAPDRWEPHPGWPSTVLAVLAIWCATRPPTPRWLLASGAAAACAYVFKQNAGAFILLALLVYRPRHALLTALGFGVVTLAWLGPLLMALGGRVELLGALVGAVNQSSLLSPPEPTIAIPAACLVAGLVLLKDRRVRWHLLAGTCLLATQYPRGDTVHLAWSAPVLLVVGAAFLSRQHLRVSLPLVAAAALLCLPTLQYRLETVRQATTTIVGIPYANSLRVPAQTWSDLLTTAAEIKHRTAPGEPIFAYPSSPLLYVLAERPNPTRFDHLNPGAATPDQIQVVIDALRQVRLLVVSDYWRAAWGSPRDNAALETWLFERYHEVARFGQYSVFVRTE